MLWHRAATADGHGADRLICVTGNSDWHWERRCDRAGVEVLFTDPAPSSHPAHLGGLEQVLRNWETPTCVCVRGRAAPLVWNIFFPESPGNSRTWWVNLLFECSALSGDTATRYPVLLTVMTCIKLIKCTYHRTNCRHVVCPNLTVNKIIPQRERERAWMKLKQL